MPKSKRSPALFEVYKRGKVRQPAMPPAQTEAKPAQPVDATSEPPEKAWVQPQGDRIRFSLSTLSLAVVIFSAAVVIFAAFYFGRNLGYSAGQADASRQFQADSGDQFAAIREGTPQPGLLDDLELVDQAVVAEEVRERREAHDGQDGFIDDLNYVWIERFGSRDDALAAQGYLAEHRIESVLAERQDKWLLISRDGFDYRIDQEKSDCQKLVEQVKEVGRQYFAAGGRYRFGCFVKKKLPGENW